MGGKAGVKVGDQFNVERVTKEIKDPTTGAVLRRLATTVGVVKATDVDDVSADLRTGLRLGLQDRRQGEDRHAVVPGEKLRANKQNALRDRCGGRFVVCD